MDEYPSNTVNYYRLKQIDYDKNFEYSNIIFIDNQIKECLSCVEYYDLMGRKTINLEFGKIYLKVNGDKRNLIFIQQ